MIFFKAQRLQRLAERLLEMQRRLEAGGGDATHIREGLEEAARRIGADLDIVRLAHPDTVLQVLAPDGGGDPGKLWGVGEILYLDGLCWLATGDEDAGIASLQKARRLLARLPPDLSLPAGAVPPSERLREVDRILDAADPEELPEGDAEV
jgi:hypothetical protein